MTDDEIELEAVKCIYRQLFGDVTDIRSMDYLLDQGRNGRWWACGLRSWEANLAAVPEEVRERAKALWLVLRLAGAVSPFDC